jgi:cell division transport system permease protein
MARQLAKNMAVVFFLEKDLEQSQGKAIEESLKKSPLVKDVQYLSSEQALERFKKNFPELQGIIDNLKINPFPCSLSAVLREENLSSGKTLAFIQEMSRMKGVEDVQFNKDWVDRIQSLSRLTRAVGLFLGGILVLASFFIISNVIKLNVLARKTEVEILRLVGASNTFIRVPFLLEGMAMGITGALASLALLFLLIKLFPLYLGSALGILSELINFRYLSPLQAVILVIGGMLIGLSGSLTSLSRFLKV